MAGEKAWLRGTFFLIGAFTLIQQTLLLREFFVIAQGNELSFGICLGNWLLGVFLGSILGRNRADRGKGGRGDFILSLDLMSLAAPLLIVLTRLIHQINATPAGSNLTLEKVFLFSAMTTLPFSFLVGYLFPFASRLSLEEGATPAGAVAGFYALEAAGALAGGLIYTFLFAGRIAPLAASCIAPCLLALLLFRLCRLWGRKRLAIAQAAGLLVLVLLLASGTMKRVDVRSARQRWPLRESTTLVEIRDSRFQNLQLGSQFGQYCIYSNGQLAMVFPDARDNQFLAVNILCQHPRPRRMLILGDAATGLAQQLLASPLQSIDAIELDPVLLDLVRRHLPAAELRLLADPRCRTLLADGRRVVQELSQAKGSQAKAYDILFVHQAEAATALSNRLFTREFFQAAAAVLEEDGIIVLRLLFSENYSAGEAGRFNACLLHTVRQIFPHTAILPGPSPLLFASRQSGVVTTRPRILLERLTGIGIETKKWERAIPYLYPRETIDAIETTLQRQRPRTNRDGRPYGYYLFSKILGWYSGSRLAPWLTGLERVRPRHLWPLPVLVLLIRLKQISGAGKRGRRPKPPVLFAVAVSGFSGLALETLTIYWFQIRFGYLYHSIGLVTALFMSGLATGAILVRSALSRRGGKAGGYVPLLAATLLLASASALFPLLFSLRSSSPLLIFLFAAAAGALTGAIFTAGLHLRLQEGSHTGREAGGINAFDHLGAALGAFATASVLLPLFGVTYLSFSIAALAILSALLFLLEKLFPAPLP